jgi:hypothetical protein
MLGTIHHPSPPEGVPLARRGCPLTTDARGVRPIPGVWPVAKGRNGGWAVVQRDSVVPSIMSDLCKNALVSLPFRALQDRWYPACMRLAPLIVIMDRPRTAP